jgi:hypothetical protein
LTIGRSEDLHGGPVFGQVALHGLHDPVEFIVGSSGIVMREGHPSDPGALAHLGNVFDRTMTPALALDILAVCELGIMDNQISPGQKLGMSSVELMHRGISFDS